jgi:hypothetical protein
MKIRITYKTPDAVYYAAKDAAEEYGGEVMDIEDELVEILGSAEYLTVEVDTLTKQVSIIKR